MRLATIANTPAFLEAIKIPIRINNPAIMLFNKKISLKPDKKAFIKCILCPENCISCTVSGSILTSAFTNLNWNDINKITQLTNTYGMVNIGTPKGLKNSLNAEPIGIVITIAIKAINILYHSGTKNSVNAIAVSTGLKPANPVLISLFE